MVGTTRLQRVGLFYVPLILFALFILFPFYWMFITSLKHNSELYNLKAIPFIVTRPTLDHYVGLITKTDFLAWTWNTMLVAVVSTGLSLVMGIMAGYALARLRFPGANIVGICIGATYLVPGTLLFIPMVQIVRQFGLYNTLWALIAVYPTFLVPFCTWLLMGYFKTIPKELEESAMIDGASRIRAMLQIALPLAMPGVLSSLIFAFTLSWNEFLYALTLITSSALKTVPVAAPTALIRGDVFFWGQLMAAALLGSVPVALFYSFFVEHYVAGLTSGAVKG
ncbi:MAG TPA: carbohydrate ABC transporter permease [Chloroflexota bacterium]|nr:carbohydrate ABC transporter permease [Chloroflexota bacterium]